MITFFRRIRKSFLNEGKTSKYLKYAIGEILLVVIGILIALQINNWNIARSNDKIEQQYITRLITELEDEIIRYKDLQESFKDQNEAVYYLLEVFNDEQHKVADTTKFWGSFFTGSGPGPWYKEPVIWTQLVQSGELKLIKNQEAVETLFKHYADVKQVGDNFNQYPTQTTNEARKLIATTFSKSDFLLNPFGMVRENPPVDNMINVFNGKDQYRVIFVRVGIIARIHRGAMERLIKSAENAVTVLRNDQITED